MKDLIGITDEYRRSRPPLIDAFGAILPTHGQTSLLRACLLHGAPARAAFDNWQACVGGPEQAARYRSRYVKALLPLLYEAHKRERFSTHPKMIGRMRSACLTEELRWEAYSELCREVLLALSAAGLRMIVLKGAALMETAWPKPQLRHSHDLDILIPQEDLVRAEPLVVNCGFPRVPPRTPLAYSVRFEHSTGLPLVLHTQACRIQLYQRTFDVFWQRSVAQEVAGTSARVLSPADCLWHVCVQAWCNSSRTSLIWVCDSWFLLEGLAEEEWSAFVERSLQTNTALPVYVMLTYLAEDVGAEIPKVALERLREAAGRTGKSGERAALLGACAGSKHNLVSMLHRAGGLRERLRAVRRILLPVPRGKNSPDRVAWTSHVPILQELRPFAAVKSIARGLCLRSARSHAASDKLAGLPSEQKDPVRRAIAEGLLQRLRRRLARWRAKRELWALQGSLWHRAAWHLLPTRFLNSRVDEKLQLAESWLFILGITNSGTTLLARILEAHSEIHGLPEEGHRVTAGLPIPRKITRRESDMVVPRHFALRPDVFRWTEADNPLPAARVRYDWARFFAGKRGILLEKSPPDTLRSRWLQRHFCPARFIVIVRHPYAVCEGICRRFGGSMEDAARQWRAAHEVLMEDIPHLGKCLKIRYEDICAEPERILAEIQSFLELHEAVDPRVLASIEVKNIEGRPRELTDFNEQSIHRLTAVDFAIINRICGPLMSLFDYTMLHDKKDAA